MYKHNLHHDRPGMICTHRAPYKYTQTNCRNSCNRAESWVRRHWSFGHMGAHTCSVTCKHFLSPQPIFTKQHDSTNNKSALVRQCCMNVECGSLTLRKHQTMYLYNTQTRANSVVIVHAHTLRAPTNYPQNQKFIANKKMIVVIPSWLSLND